MTDTEIISLYWSRSDRAIAETDAAYGGYCYAVAYGVLSNREDAEESVNDSYLAAWNAMPPTWPDSLKAFLGKLCRRVSLSRLRKNLAAKRGGGEAVLAVEELSECLPSSFDTEGAVEAKELAGAIDRFLGTLPEEERNLFLARYWFVTPLRTLASRLGVKESSLKTRLYRSRQRLRAFLEKEGFC